MDEILALNRAAPTTSTGASSTGTAAPRWVRGSGLSSVPSPQCAQPGQGVASAGAGQRGGQRRHRGQLAGARGGAPPSPCEILPELSVLDYWCPEYSYPSEHAVVAGAASTVLGYLFPMDAQRYQDLAARQRPRACGEGWPTVAMSTPAWIWATGRTAGDCPSAAPTARTRCGEAEFRPGPACGTTPPMAMDGVRAAGRTDGRVLATVEPDVGDQFRPDPPPEPAGPESAAAMREVYDVAKSLTVEQQQVAQFWADGPGTASPAGHWNTIALDLIKKYMVYTSEAAVILGALNTAQADAFIACWDAKYTYWDIRPITVIRQGIDGTWTPYLQTPFFPSYVSGHATVSGAAAEILAHFFPKDAGWLRDSAKTAARSRLYGGIHTTFENDTGLRLGQQVAGATLQRLGGVSLRIPREEVRHVPRDVRSEGATCPVVTAAAREPVPGGPSEPCSCAAISSSGLEPR